LWRSQQVRRRLKPDLPSEGEDEMAYWTFTQNNSGGSFDYDEDRGITHFVIIEADSRDEAISRAEEIGIYFDGCDKGIDCCCCGDRWHEPFHDEGSPFPEVYGDDVRKQSGATLWATWMKPGREIVIHPKSGSLEWFGGIKATSAA